MLIQNISFLTWDILLSAFLLVSVFLYLMMSGRKAALLLVLSAYLGYAVAIAVPDLISQFQYSQYFRPLIFVGALLASLHMFGKLIVLKRWELTFITAVLFSLLASGMSLSMFFHLIGAGKIILNPFIVTVFVGELAHFAWLVLPLIILIALFKK